MMIIARFVAGLEAMSGQYAAAQTTAGRHR